MGSVWKHIKIYIPMCIDRVILVHEFTPPRTYIQAFVQVLFNFYQICYQWNDIKSIQEYFPYPANVTFTTLNKMILNLLLCKILLRCFSLLILCCSWKSFNHFLSSFELLCCKLWVVRNISDYKPKQYFSAWSC